METADLVVIGAGVRGLAMAKTYHQVHHHARILILDSSETLGGCWAEERLYPDLRTNNVSILAKETAVLRIVKDGKQLRLPPRY